MILLLIFRKILGIEFVSVKYVNENTLKSISIEIQE